MDNLLLYIIIYYMVINLLAIITMYYDKRQAINNGYRVSEKTLFVMAFILGGVGIYLGMILFRHKTKHLKFKILVPVSIILNFSLLIYIFYKYFMI